MAAMGRSGTEPSELTALLDVGTGEVTVRLFLRELRRHRKLDWAWGAICSLPTLPKDGRSLEAVAPGNQTDANPGLMSLAFDGDDLAVPENPAHFTPGIVLRRRTLV